MAAPLRLGENRRLNKEVHFSPRRKDAKAAKEKRPLLWRHLILKKHKSRPKLILPLLSISCSAGADSVWDQSLRDCQRGKYAVGVTDVEQHPFRNLPHHLFR